MNIQGVNYKDILHMEKDFISLDISVKSTGWVRSKNGEIDYGTYSLKSVDDTGRRVEFREFLQSIIGEDHYSVVYVEDVIAGTNFNTTKSLIQLNTIIDDLKAFDMVKVDRIVREDNKRWKKYLKQASNYIPVIKKEDDKIMIRNSLNLIGFKEEVEQDIYDAIGLAVAVIFREKVLGEEKKENKPLKKDIRRGYKIKQYKSKKSLEVAVKKESEKRKREIEYIDWVEENRDIVYLFKQKINNDNIDNKVYGITIRSKKLGILVLNKKLSTEEDITYLMVTKNR